jgi:hypothetical protein
LLCVLRFSDLENSRCDWCECYNSNSDYAVKLELFMS